MTAWEVLTGKVKTEADLARLYQHPEDRDFAARLKEGSLSFGSASPEGLVYFPAVLAFYLNHRPPFARLRARGTTSRWESFWPGREETQLKGQPDGLKTHHEIDHRSQLPEAPVLSRDRPGCSYNPANEHGRHTGQVLLHTQRITKQQFERLALGRIPYLEAHVRRQSLQAQHHPPDSRPSRAGAWLEALADGVS